MSESKSASVVFTNSSLLAKNAQSAADNAKQLAIGAQANAMFYVGDTQPSNPQVGMVWVRINEANDNLLAQGRTSNTLRSGVVAKGSWSYTVAYGTPNRTIPKGSIMTASIWLDLTGENVSDLFLNLMSHQNNNQWWATKYQNVKLPDGTVTPTVVPIKAGQKGWVTLTFQFPADTDLGRLEFYVSRLEKDGVATQDIPIKFSSPKLEWGSKRTQWCDGTNTNKGNVDNAQKWDGTKWVPTAFTSDVIADYIYGKNIIGSTFANAEGSFKVDSNGNINGASINGSSFNSSTGHIDQNNGANSPWMPWAWDNATFNVNSGFISTTANNAVVPGQGFTANVIGTYSPAYLKFTLWSTDGKSEYGRSYLDSGGLYIGIGSDATNIGPDSVQASKVYANNELDAGNLILAGNTIYNNKQKDIYFTNGDVGTAYSGHAATIHATVINSSTLSAKTDLQKLDEQDAINAIKNIEEYSYQYIGDAERGSKQRYVSGIIDDVNQTPQYKMDPLFIYENGRDRVDSNLLNVQTVVIQNLLKRVEKLESLTSGKQ